MRLSADDIRRAILHLDQLLDTYRESSSGPELEVGDDVAELVATLRRLAPAEHRVPTSASGPDPARPPAGADPGYEVTFQLDADDDAVERLEDAWASVGHSILLVGGGGEWTCHIHTDDPGAAIEAAVEAGRPRRIRVAPLGGEPRASAGPGSDQVVFQPRMEASVAPVGVLAVVDGSGFVDLFRELGAQGVVPAGPSMRLSTEDLVAAVEAVPAPRVILLPNHPGIVPLAEQVDALTDKRVEVVPTRNMQQGVAAILGYSFAGEDLGRTAEDMAAAASAIFTGEVVRAARDAEVELGRVRRGDWLGISEGRALVADPSLEAALSGLVAAILPDVEVELVTLYSGEGARSSAYEALEAWLAEVRPEVRLKQVEGGQGASPYLVAVE